MGFGKDGKGAIIRDRTSGALATLGPGEAIKIDALAITEDFRMLKAEILARFEGATAGEPGGLIFGICDGELSVTEIAECLNAEGPLDNNDRDSYEKATRPVWPLSQPSEILPTAGIFPGKEGGPMIIHKGKPWTFSNNEGWDFFVFNDNVGALTTGCTVNIVYTAYGVWVT